MPDRVNRRADPGRAHVLPKVEEMIIWAPSLVR